MNIRSATTRLVTLLAATTLTVAGCGVSKDADAPSTPDSSSSAASSTAEQQDKEPQVSPAIIERRRDNGKMDKTQDLQVITGEDRWTITPDMGIDGANGLDIGRRADAFVRQHVLRRDRWTGKYAIKEGELDAYRKKVTPALADKVIGSLEALEADRAAYGATYDKWPKKAKKANAERASNYGYLLLNDDLADGGTGDYIIRVTEREIFMGNKEWGWSGAWLGQPISYMTVQTARKNGTGTGKTYGIYQGWKKVKGQWTVFTAGYNTK